MIQYFGYTRVSTKRQGQYGVSLQEQRASIESYASSRGLVISRWFEEQETASRTGRTEFRHMVQALTRGDANGLIIHKIDRGARNLRDWAEIGDLIDLGIDVRFAHDDLRLDSRCGRLAADIQAVIAADYVRNLREELRKGFVGHLKKGLYPLPAPFGYRNQARHHVKVPHPHEAQVVRELFALYATGEYSIRALSTMMCERGRVNTRFGPMRSCTIDRILRNPFYTGVIRIKRSGLVYPGVHQPLVERAQFDRVQELLASRRAGQRRSHTFRYQRLVRCGCGYMLVGELKKQRYIYYRCHHCKVSLREQDLSEKIAAMLPPLDIDPGMSIPARCRAAASEYVFRDGQISLPRAA